MALRARPGVPIYLLAWLLLGATVSFQWPLPASLVLGGLIAALSIVRLVLVIPGRFRIADVDRWQRLFRISTVALGFTLGCQAGLILLRFGLYGGSNMALTITAAIGAVAIFVFAPDLPLVVAFPIALNAPLAAALLWRGGGTELASLAADLIFVGYCVLIGRRLHVEHWDAARSAQSLRDHALELEGARERLRRGRDELEREVEERTRELREREDRYRALFEASPLPLWVCDPETLAIRDVNEAAVAHYGYTRDEFRETTLLALQTSADDHPLSSVEHEVTSVHRKKDGTKIRVEIVSRDLELDGRRARLVLAHDVTARELLEEQLRQARKMEAIGRLAGGVAHDFNNVLTAILGYGELLQSKIGANPELKGPLDEILVAGKRAAALTRQLLAFSRKQILAPEVIDLNVLVRNLTGMLVPIIGEDIELVTRMDASPVRVKADPGQIEQVILNLVVNARDAMPDGGRLDIETALLGSIALLSIRDTGTGIDEEARGHLFEPFFTTKAQGRGTGLGLATVQGIVEQSGGRVEVSSESGVGTEVRVTLPSCGEGRPKAVSRSSLRTTIPRGSETVLLVEDEKQVRMLVERLLREHGYTVVCASDGEEALRVSAERGAFDLLLTDLVLPGIGGAELAARLRSKRAGLRVLFISGYTSDTGARRRIEEDQDAYLPKPFEPAVLLRRVRALLDAPELPSAAGSGAP